MPKELTIQQSAQPAEVRPVLELLPYQKAAITRESRFTWNCWSRQAGKSFTFSLRRVLRGLLRKRNQIILSAGERQSREVMDKVRMHCLAMKVWCDLHGWGFFDNTSFRRLEARLPGGVRIIALPANPMTARGFTGDVFLDEFAMHRDDEAIWAALFPTLLRGEGELDIASTPRGRKNLFYRLRNNPRFAHDTVTLTDAVKQGLDVDADAMREAIGDEQAWRQEFCCQFVDESTSFMTYELILACQDQRLKTDVDWKVLGRDDSDIYVGIDVGRHRDVTAIWLWQRQNPSSRPACHLPGNEKSGVPSSGHTSSASITNNLNQQVRFITLGVIVMQNAPFAEQESQIAKILEHRGVRRCCMDATGMGLHLAENLAERFGEHRVQQVVFTPGIKNQLAGGLRVMAERNQLQIPVDRTIVDDWHSISRVVSGAGHLRLEADRSAGGHADRFWAAALGLYAADGSAGLNSEIGLITSGPLTFARRGVW